MPQCLTIDSGGNAISTVNSRVASSLAAGEVFQGTGEDVSKYARVGVSVYSSTASSGTLWLEVSHDNVNWSGPSRTWEDTRFAQPHMWEIVEKYFRIKYLNGTTAVSDLAIQVQYSVNGSILLGHQLNESLKDETEAIVTRSVLVGKQTDGSYTNVPVSAGSGLKTYDSPSSTNTELLGHIHDQLQLLNARFEEAFRTGITLEDIENGYN